MAISEDPAKGDARTEQPDAVRARLRETIKSLDQRIEHEPKNADAYLERGRTRQLLRQYVGAAEKQKLGNAAIQDFESANKCAGDPGMAIALVEAGRVHLASFNFSEAMPYFEKASVIAPEDIEVRAELAKMKGLTTDSWEEPLQTLLRLSRDAKGATSPGVWHALGLAYGGAGRFEEGEKAFRRKLELAPDEVRTWSNIGLMLQSQGKIKESLDAQRRVLAADPTDIHAALNLANALVAMDDPALARTAVEVLLPAVEAVPTVPAAWNNLGNAYAKLSDEQKAMSAYRRALELQPDFAAVHNNVGLLHAKARRWEKAVASYRRALELAPRKPEYLYHLGNAYSASGSYEEAESTLLEFVKIAPDDPRGWNNLGSVRLELGRVAEARAAYEAALRANPRHAGSLANLGLLDMRESKDTSAIEYLRKALQEDPDAGSVLENLGLLLLKTGREDAAIEDIRSVAARTKNRAPMHFVLCNLHFHRGELREASAACDEAIVADPDFSRALMERGVVRLAKGDLDGAIADLRRAGELNPQETYAFFFLWVVSARKGVDRGTLPAVPGNALKRLRKGSWEFQLAAFVNGTISRDQLVRLAESDEQRCEAYYYIAERVRFESGPGDARPWFEKCAATAVRHFLEYRLAVRELERE